MFVTIRENLVGVVEDGVVVEAYSNSETIEDVYNNDVTPIDSKIIGEKALSDNLVRVNYNDGEFKMNHNIGETEKVSPDTPVGEVIIKEYI
jgi:hypothetical protein